jgi:hypothetical protein
MISTNPTVEELRQHSKDTFDAIQAGWVKQPPGAGFENVLLSILLQQMVAAYEIAAQLAELNTALAASTSSPGKVSEKVFCVRQS